MIIVLIPVSFSQSGEEALTNPGLCYISTIVVCIESPSICVVTSGTLTWNEATLQRRGANAQVEYFSTLFLA